MPAPHPRPTPFTGTTRQRATQAVAYARQGFPLTTSLFACGYSTAYSPALREILAGDGPAIRACRQAVETGRVDFHGNTGQLRFIRDFYGLPKLNGDESGRADNKTLRKALRGCPNLWPEITHHVGLYPRAIQEFVRGSYDMRESTRRRVWQALKEAA